MTTEHPDFPQWKLDVAGPAAQTLFAEFLAASEASKETARAELAAGAEIMKVGRRIDGAFAPLPGKLAEFTACDLALSDAIAANASASAVTGRLRRELTEHLASATVKHQAASRALEQHERVREAVAILRDALPERHRAYAVCGHPESEAGIRRRRGGMRFISTNPVPDTLAAELDALEAFDVAGVELFLAEGHGYIDPASAATREARALARQKAAGIQ